MAREITALLLGDIVGQPGCRAVFIRLKSLIKKYHSDIVIANGENAADGFGITPEIMEQLFSSGVDVITSGNHIWQKKEIFSYFDTQERLLRPANYPKEAPGHGYCEVEVKGVKVAVINLQGRDRLSPIDCPFHVGKNILKKLKSRIRIVDFHAEAPDEKEALAYYLDGSVSAVVGTHTHIQTADERILEKGTAFITDIGMTGPVNTVIGMDIPTAIKRALTQLPLKMEVPDEPAEIRGVLLRIDEETGKTLSIERVHDVLSL